MILMRYIVHVFLALVMSLAPMLTAESSEEAKDRMEERVYISHDHLTRISSQVFYQDTSLQSVRFEDDHEPDPQFILPASFLYIKYSCLKLCD